jgi:exodeoxyribonuclease V gamma subunit
MLRVVHSNRFEALSAALQESLPSPPSPLAQHTVVVASHPVAAYLQYDIACGQGICIGVDFPFIDQFLAQTYADGDARGRGLRPLGKDPLTAVISSVLSDPGPLTEDELAPVRDYLGSEQGRDGRRVQLSRQLAGVYWAYSLSRPDWLFAWQLGRAEVPAMEDPSLRWQAVLWRLIAGAAGREYRYCLLPQLARARKQLGLATPTLARPVHVIGFSHLAPAHLEALTDLSTTGDVTVYLVDPCSDYWYETTRWQDAEGTAMGLPRGSTAQLLGLWSRPVRDTLSTLVEASAGNLHDRFSHDPAPATAHARLLADLAGATEPAPDAGGAVQPPGLMILACPSADRELDIVASDIARQLETNPDLRAHEIAVLVAGASADRTLAHLPGVFRRTLGDSVPFHLVGIPAQGQTSWAAALALLELPTTRLTRKDLLGIMTHPCVLATYPHVDPNDWVAWADRLAILHGADQHDHEHTYLENADHFHWDQGILRLALGAFMATDADGDPSPAEVGTRHLVPTPVASDESPSAATFALLARSLIADARWLSAARFTLTGWANVLAQWIQTYLTGPSEFDGQELDAVVREIRSLAGLDLDGRKLGFAETAEVLQHRLSQRRVDRGEVLTDGIMVAQLTTMRPLPFRQIYLLGLSEENFPSSERQPALDARQQRLRADVTPRDGDRQAFFEALLGARERLVLSHVAADPTSGEVRSPSLLLLELGHALAPYLGLGSSADALAAITVRHPLHRWDARYQHDPRLVPSRTPTLEDERRSAAIRVEVSRHCARENLAFPTDHQLWTLAGVAPRAPEPQRPPAIPSVISLSTLRQFLEYPVQAWAKASLGLLERPDTERHLRSDEPFEYAPAGRAGILREVLARHLGPDRVPVHAAYQQVIAARMARGGAPFGVFAAAASRRYLELLEEWVAALTAHGATAAQTIAFGPKVRSRDAVLRPPLRVSVRIGEVSHSVELVGRTELFTGEVSLLATQGDVKKAHHLRCAFQHLILAAAGVTPDREGSTLLLADEPRISELAHAQWSQAEALAHLGVLLADLLGRPHAYDLPAEALIAALSDKVIRSRGDRDHDFGPIYRSHRLGVPDDATALAERRARPLIDRLTVHRATAKVPHD